ncbi:MAG: hypothetical protein NUW37_02025 [Planctomycetes bacterium]|nr:hypothetical protein [Planctomycetota bacterium]
MANLWGKAEDFKAVDIPTPKSILEEQAEYLREATNGDVYAEVSDLSGSASWNFEKREFAYSFYICAAKVKYKFRLMTITHDISIYPVTIDELDSEVRNGIGWTKPTNPLANNQEDFNSLLGKILKTDRVRKVIGGILGLSK